MKGPIVQGNLLSILFFLLLCFHHYSSEITTTYRQGLVEVEARRETGIAPYTYDASRVLVIQLADEERQVSYKHQMDTVSCWAAEMDMRYLRADPRKFENCKRNGADYYHAQICAIHEIMKENRDKIDYVVKIDGDVLGGLSERGLTHWLNGSDFIGQERFYTSEINAGFYMVRNSENGRNIVQDWAEYTFRTNQTKGYKGNDNGSIHQVLVDALELNGRTDCYNRLKEITTGSSISEYFEYVACARMLLGPPRLIVNPINQVSVTIWPAVFGPMMDVTSLHYYGVIGANLRGYYPLHHGIKDVTNENINRLYG
eukprot:GHVH01009031.1.p1 GENE.GHVH01009031.1~~GHVH01009031.1.p1  ORF type:complete len:314 (-),score=35.19 GHVH01009031.1:1527-2468(-)